MPEFSILIPTYNRKEKLQVVLEQVQRQKGIEKGEVIIGVDGSTDGTEEWMEGMYGKEGTKGTDGMEGGIREMSWFRIENSGRAVIRNKLLERARGEIVIFIQDDIVVTEGWLEAHLAFHRAKKGALVGHITWYPEVVVTPYMEWLESGGHLLDFSGLQDGQELDFWHFYMGNISLPRVMIGSLRFDESIPGYGWEDILFGYEFVSKGNRVYYSCSALAYHWDEYHEKDLQGYMAKVGKSAVWAERRYPGVGFMPPFWKRFLFRIMIGAGTAMWPLLSQRQKWYVHMKKWFLQGSSQER